MASPPSTASALTQRKREHEKLKPCEKLEIFKRSSVSPKSSAFEWVPGSERFAKVSSGLMTSFHAIQKWPILP
jgi:hypothetical protein